MEIPNWFAQTAEPYFRRHLSGKQGMSCLQIGAFAGHATEWLVRDLPNCTVTDVDPWTGSDEDEHRALNWQSVIDAYFDRLLNEIDEQRVLVRRMTSAEFFLRESHDNEYDFIYVDGDHRAQSVLFDAVSAWELLKVGGIMAFDDYEWNGPSDPVLCPKLAIDSFLACYRDRLEVIDRGIQVWVRKRS